MLEYVVILTSIFIIFKNLYGKLCFFDSMYRIFKSFRYNINADGEKGIINWKKYQHL